MPDWNAIRHALADAGVDLADENGEGGPRPVRGGDISAAWRYETGDGALFLKTGPRAAQDMFGAEAEGLRELASANAVRVPKALAAGAAGRDAFIALEWLDFERTTRGAERVLGERLAALHRHTAERYGWHRDNTIGRTAQKNSWHDDWVEFFRDERLAFQLDLAAANGYGGELQTLGRQLAEGLQALFDGYRPEASLLHGDLWGGNWAVAGGEPVIFDPAVYYGDRESDLAMTRLFGGFGPEFYAGYDDAWPLADGADLRVDLYQLYHLLNHLNLFGGAYASSAVAALGRLVERL
jgi:fructosamine-3-kinase